MLTDPKLQREGFSVVVNQYSEPLYWKIRRMVLSHDDANDVLQNTFIKAWNNLSTFQNKSRFSTWLYRIAINESLDFLRHQKLVQRVSADEDETIASKLMADDYFDGDETMAQLQEAIASLPDVQRTVFNMRYYDQMKYSEMSLLLDTTEGALKASYHLAVKKIKEYFDKRE
ncbi:MAG: sigma-70 family RNA polymerase sigma factor [Prevotella sp.]|nr:sigma-70 family RNA polymerase sigma factor [Prevotella sp.]